MSEYQKQWRKAHPGYDAKIAKAYRENHRDRYLLTHRKQRLKKYGLTVDTFEQLLNAQNRLCKICNTNVPGGFANQWAIDHCHKTGKVRGILCNNCNKGLGHFKDQVELLNNAKVYLEAA